MCVSAKGGAGPHLFLASACGMWTCDLSSHLVGLHLILEAMHLSYCLYIDMSDSTTLAAHVLILYNAMSFHMQMSYVQVQRYLDRSAAERHQRGTEWHAQCVIASDHIHQWGAQYIQSTVRCSVCNCKWPYSPQYLLNLWTHEHMYRCYRYQQKGVTHDHSVPYIWFKCVHSMIGLQFQLELSEGTKLDLDLDLEVLIHLWTCMP